MPLERNNQRSKFLQQFRPARCGNADATPTCTRRTSVEYIPRRSEATTGRSSAHRNPATTQSAVRSRFTFTMARFPGSYRNPRCLATTPSNPDASGRSSHAAAFAGSSVMGVRKSGEVVRSSTRSSAARRSTKGRSRRSRPPLARRSNPTKDAGVSRRSRSMRDAAGCSLASSAAKSKPSGPRTRISPSSTIGSSEISRNARTSSGK
jgi:hypothetical protein